MKVTTTKNSVVISLNTSGGLVSIDEENLKVIKYAMSLDPKYSKHSIDVAEAFDKLKLSTKSTFESEIKKVIRLIGQINSTRTSDLAISNMVKNLIGAGCNDYARFEEMLKENINVVKSKHLLIILASEVTSKIGGQKTCNLSLASKFCQAAAEYLLKDENAYCKYDYIVSNLLSTYLYIDNIKYEFVPYSSSEKNKVKDINEYLLKVYLSFVQSIDKILLKHKPLSRRAFDLIVWYSYR